MSFDHAFEKILTLYGGRRALAQALGVGPSALSNYVARQAMPVNKRSLLARDLRRRGYVLDDHSFEIQKTDDHHITGKDSQHKPVCLLIITGGIACYKSLELARRMMDAGWQVRAVMTQSAQEFITALSVSALTGEKVYTELFSLTDEQEMGHIRLAREADIVLVAPATGNFIAKIATGLADDLASTLCLASEAPLYFVPAMNPVMWAQPVTQENCAKLRHRGAKQIGPAVGDTACGEIGAGRMAEVADIIAQLPQTGTPPPKGRLPLSGRHIMVTAGPTREPVDGVRYISNHSSGKQGYAIAAACAAAGADVTLISGPTELEAPRDVSLVDVMTAQQMYEAALSSLPCDVAICTAAVADWHVVGASHQKLKKADNHAPPQLELAENPDILKSLSFCDERPLLVIGFAAETENVISAAIAKRARKGCDWMMVNEITKDKAVFGAQDNQLTLIRDGEETRWETQSKEALSQRLVGEIISFFETETKKEPC
ncbi:MAG: bifunctional phosphopantothenoylcysteine decarboxylase/phosphopantothenate--cysteine ligase CoaBC [Candidatus Puniceispirillaceae bacterium]